MREWALDVLGRFSSSMPGLLWHYRDTLEPSDRVVSTQERGTDTAHQHGVLLAFGIQPGRV